MSYLLALLASESSRGSLLKGTRLYTSVVRNI